MAERRPTSFEFSGDAGRYRLSGVAGFGNGRALLEQGSAAFQGQAAVEVDLSGVTSTDSAGLAVLLTWVERARANGQRLRFEGLPGQLVAIARVCGVESMLAASAGS